jgi:phenylacetate-CoA ligase
MFHQILDLLDAAGWQVRQHPDRLEVLLASPAPGYDPTQTEQVIRAALTQAGVVATPVEITAVQAIPPGPAGKRPLVMADPAERPPLPST